MKTFKNILLFLTVVVFLSNCATARSERRYDFSLENTLSVFMLNNEKGSSFCIPVQYMGDYQIQSFEFSSGSILIGGYEIALERDKLTIAVYLNEAGDETGSSVSGFNLIYLEENGQILISKMEEPLAFKESVDLMNHYYIFIEKNLSDDDVKNITGEFENGNVYSRLSIKYDLIIDNEEQFGYGMYDDFEIYDGTAMDPVFFPPNLNFFKIKYLE